MNSEDFEYWSAELDSHTPSLDVHGFSVSTALHEVDYFLDKSLTSPHTICKIIHGAGTGALKNALKKSLSLDSRIQSFRDSTLPHESGAVLYIKLH